MVVVGRRRGRWKETAGGLKAARSESPPAFCHIRPCLIGTLTLASSTPHVAHAPCSVFLSCARSSAGLPQLRICLLPPSHPHRGPSVHDITNAYALHPALMFAFFLPPRPV